MVIAAPPNPRATVAPGICLIVSAAISSVLLVLIIMAGVVTVVDQGWDEDDVFLFVFLGLTLAIQFLILWGGINMVRRRGYRMALVGGFAAIVPLSGCCCLSLPIGVWGLVTLTKSGMRTVFSSEGIRQDDI
jgi:hypothetical protein